MQIAARIGVNAPNDSVDWESLFKQMCSDTWPKDIVLPITEIRRSFCFVSSTVENVTFPLVTDLRTLSGANPFYTCPRLDSCYLPNVTELRGSPLLGSAFKHFYFSKPLTFPEYYPLNHNPTVHRTLHLNQTHDTVQNDVLFPFTNVESYKSNNTFACTDGELNYDGSEWVFTPSA